MTESAVTSQICILGGGFGGLYTALRLAQFPWSAPPEITLVDHSDRFVFTPLLYELITGELQAWEIAPPFVELLKDTPVVFHQGTVTAIDLKAKTVHLSEGKPLTYEKLVLALGGETPKNSIPGVAEYAVTFRTLSDAYRLEEALQRCERSDRDRIRVVVVGAGPSGVELACKLAERLGSRGRIRLVDRNTEILKSSQEFNRKAALRALEERGVWIDLQTTPVAVTADRISLQYKDRVDDLPVDIVLWTVGTAVSPVIAALDLPKTSTGRLQVIPTLQVVDHPEIFALGDAADAVDEQGQAIPHTAQAAFQEADYAAWNLWASLSDRPLLPCRYSHLGEMLTLGTDRAALAGLGLTLDGPLAYLARRLAYLYRMPTLEHQLKVGLNWMAKPILDLLTGTVN
ncbi:MULTISPECIES: NAD(P)/FAD-dependent oxidoreductase [unclassified Thermosynechococcus]|uniref:NAD(P)/FAD-dependent oxidoreductase n=1 Tax=unclassified Thermosynechococcus TaxID=2622553 RepID=UPI001A0D9143|nr:MULTISPECIES: NAD(P)/FAD-dependent oxidoreductase [unclassified Thermosynechococcus]HIK36316.1 NAD(P)/FAD-dependent oxidoreductase [Thermosynechococcus sp. M98_K2018_005]HIK48266.1 NAD(P)/FAD-dependent oxidoreductase [Thermosynechococcus sp. M55_K2018_012]